jgi:hypothetical protein
MNRFKVHAFFAEFPFLVTGDSVVRDVGRVEEVAVSRISKEFLDKEPKYKGVTGSLVDIGDNEQVFLLDKSGNTLATVKQGYDVTHNEAHMDDELSAGETVGEALLRIDPAQVHYAVVVHTGYEIQDHHSVGGYSVTLHKAPKGFTLKGWVEEQKRRARAQVEAMVVEIDAEA